MRKTVELTKVLDAGNFFLANSPDDQVRERVATANLMETLIHAADAYEGFGYLESAGLAKNPTFNEAWDRYRAVIEIARANGLTDLYESDKVIQHPRWEDYCKDDSRRVYYYHPAIV